MLFNLLGFRSELSWLALGEVLGCRSELDTEKIQTEAEDKDRQRIRERETDVEISKGRDTQKPLPFLEAAQFPRHPSKNLWHPLLVMLAGASSPVFHSLPGQLWVVWWRGVSVLLSSLPTPGDQPHGRAGHWMEAEGHGGLPGSRPGLCLQTSLKEARYWSQKLEQLNAMRDQDEVRWHHLPLSPCLPLSSTLYFSLRLSSPVSVSLTLCNLTKFCDSRGPVSNQ